MHIACFHYCKTLLHMYVIIHQCSPHSRPHHSSQSSPHLSPFYRLHLHPGPPLQGQFHRENNYCWAPSCTSSHLSPSHRQRQSESNHTFKWLTICCGIEIKIDQDWHPAILVELSPGREDQRADWSFRHRRIGLVEPLLLPRSRMVHIPSKTLHPKEVHGYEVLRCTSR